VDSANVIAGSGQMYLAPAGTAVPTLTSLPITWTGFTSPGYTDDGVEFIYSPTFKDINVDEEMAPVKKLLTAEKLEINIKMAETTLLNLQKAIAGSSLTEGAGVSTLYLGSAAALQEWVLGFVGPAPVGGGNSTRVILCWRVMPIAAVTFKYQRKDKVVYAVKFEALADSTQAAGQRLAKIIDYNSAGS
jgi:hypothetical protein